MKNQKDARALLVFSMAIFGTLGLFVRNIQLSSGPLAFYRAILAAVLIGGFLFVTKQKNPGETVQKGVANPTFIWGGDGFQLDFTF